MGRMWPLSWNGFDTPPANGGKQLDVGAPDQGRKKPVRVVPPIRMLCLRPNLPTSAFIGCLRRHSYVRASLGRGVVRGGVAGERRCACHVFCVRGWSRPLLLGVQPSPTAAERSSSDQHRAAAPPLLSLCVWTQSSLVRTLPHWCVSWRKRQPVSVSLGTNAGPFPDLLSTSSTWLSPVLDMPRVFERVVEPQLSRRSLEDKQDCERWRLVALLRGALHCSLLSSSYQLLLQRTEEKNLLRLFELDAASSPGICREFRGIFPLVRLGWCLWIPARLCQWNSHTHPSPTLPETELIKTSPPLSRLEPVLSRRHVWARRLRRRRSVQRRSAWLRPAESVPRPAERCHPPRWGPGLRHHSPGVREGSTSQEQHH